MPRVASFALAVALLLPTPVLSAPVVPPPSRQPSASAAIDTLVAQEKYDEAIQKGRDAVNARPDDPDLRKALAGALAAKAKRVEKVADVPVTQQDIDAGSMRVKLPGKDAFKTKVVYDAGLFEESVLNLDRAIRLAPARKDLRQSLIYLLSDAGRVDRASTAMKDALAALPRAPDTAHDLASLGAERTKRGDAAGGAALLGVVAQSYPGDAVVQADYGFSLTKLGKNPEALAAFDAAATAAPGDLRILRMRATAAMLFRDFAKARSAYDAAFRAGRQDPDRLGAAAAAYGVDPKAALPDLEEIALPAASSDPTAVELASLYVAAAKAGPTSPAAINLAKKLTGEGQPVLALPILEQALRAKPPAKEAADLRKKAYEDLGFGSLVGQE